MKRLARVAAGALGFGALVAAFIVLFASGGVPGVLRLLAGLLLLASAGFLAWLAVYE